MAQPESWQHVADALGEGAVAILPTETFYGLAASVECPDAVRRIHGFKMRDTGRPLPVICGTMAQVTDLVQLPDWFIPATHKFWPGPMTVVAPCTAVLPPEVIAPDGTLAIRITSDPIAAWISHACGAPLTSTSANPAGGEPPISVSAIDGSVLKVADCVIDDGRRPGGAPSTIVRINGPSLELLRSGVIDFDTIRGEVGR
jgi:L-threonylcarbamoyladenylate synthase